MTFLPADKLPHDPARLALRAEQRAVLDAYEALLKQPVFEKNIDVNVLAKIAADPDSPVREKRRAAEVLLAFRLKVSEQMASLLAVREQVLDELGLASAAGTASTVNVTQVNANTKIEIVRDADWRDAATSDDRG